MSVPVYIGDAVSAAGFRLAGLRIHVPDTTELVMQIEQAATDASLVLLGADLAAQLPVAELDRLFERSEQLNSIFLEIEHFFGSL